MIYKEQKPGVCAPDKIEKLINSEETVGCDDDGKQENVETEVVIIRQPRKSKESNEELKPSGIGNYSYIENNKTSQCIQTLNMSAGRDKKEPKRSEVVPKTTEESEELVIEPQIPAISAVEKQIPDKVEAVQPNPIRAVYFEKALDQKIISPDETDASFDAKEKIDIESEAVIILQPKKVIESIDDIKKNCNHNALVQCTPLADIFTKEEKLEPDNFEVVTTVQSNKMGESEVLSATVPMGDEQDFNYDDESSEFTTVPAMSGEEEKQEPDKFEVETSELPRKMNMTANLSRADSNSDIEYGCVSRYIIMVCSWNDYAVPVIFSIPVLLVGACSYGWGACLPCAARHL